MWKKGLSFLSPKSKASEARQANNKFPLVQSYNIHDLFKWLHNWQLNLRAHTLRYHDEYEKCVIYVHSLRIKLHSIPANTQQKAHSANL